MSIDPPIAITKYLFVNKLVSLDAYREQQNIEAENLIQE